MYNMGIFKHKDKRTEETPSIERNEKRYIIKVSSHFRGFQRFPVVIHGNETSEQNNDFFLNTSLDNTTLFEFVVFYERTIAFEGRMALVFINNKQVGAVFDTEQIQAIENDLIEKIHIVTSEDKIKFFVKYRE